MKEKESQLKLYNPDCNNVTITERDSKRGSQSMQFIAGVIGKRFSLVQIVNVFSSFRVNLQISKDNI